MTGVNIAGRAVVPSSERRTRAERLAALENAKAMALKRRKQREAERRERRRRQRERHEADQRGKKEFPDRRR